ncbi:MAG: hypothetical protein ACKOPO_10680 [Novosphingobium sp.]
MFESTGCYGDALVRTPAGWRIRQRRCRMQWWRGNSAVLETMPGIKVEHVLDSLKADALGRAGIAHIAAMLA